MWQLIKCNMICYFFNPITAWFNSYAFFGWNNFFPYTVVTNIREISMSCAHASTDYISSVSFHLLFLFIYFRFHFFVVQFTMSLLFLFVFPLTCEHAARSLFYWLVSFTSFCLIFSFLSNLFTYIWRQIAFHFRWTKLKSSIRFRFYFRPSLKLPLPIITEMSHFKWHARIKNRRP